METRQRAPQKRDWRQPLVTGLSVGLAVAVARDVGRNLEAVFGYGWATASALAAAGAVGALVALAAVWLFRPMNAS